MQFLFSVVTVALGPSRVFSDSICDFVYSYRFFTSSWFTKMYSLPSMQGFRNISTNENSTFEF